MLETINQYAAYLDQASLLSYPISLFLGVLAALGALSCYLPLVPAMIGFAGGQQFDRRKMILFPSFIMLGSILTLGTLGAVVSVSGLALQNAIGPYWGYAIGIICILAGLTVLRVVKIPRISLPRLNYAGFWSPLLFGMVVGGGLGFGSSCCVPTLPIVLTYAGIQGKPLHGALVLTFFAIGQSIPIFIVCLFSSTLGKITGRWSQYVHKLSGAALLLVGVYFIVWR
jgi:cytochrome c biogenesis protein CcdA